MKNYFNFLLFTLLLFVDSTSVCDSKCTRMMNWVQRHGIKVDKIRGLHVALKIKSWQTNHLTESLNCLIKLLPAVLKKISVAITKWNWVLSKKFSSKAFWWFSIYETQPQEWKMIWDLIKIWCHHFIGAHNV